MPDTVTRLGVVVGVDGSPESNAAVCWAARNAALRNVPVTVVHVVDTPAATWPQLPYPDALGVWREDQGRQILAHATKIAEEAPTTDRTVDVRSELVLSTPVSTLIEMSSEAELVVVGSAGRGALMRGLLGSVSSSVVRRSSCPVAVVRDEDPLMPHPQRAPVLVGIDGSPASERATAIAFDEASRRGVELMAVHAWSDVSVFELPGLDLSAMAAEAERSLAERLAGWQERYPDVKVRRIIKLDNPARYLLEQSDAAQLTVLGTHGRGSVTRMFLGSVSTAVAESSRTPVIMVPGR